MIVRNEENFLGDCLRSIQPIVDEIVVVDTGSVDSTVDIAKKFSARVFNFTWRDDFSAARNYCIEHCASDWILYIDADERVASNSPQINKSMLQNSWLAATVGLKPKSGYTRYLLPRLFRRDPRIRFSGIIHETIVPSLETLMANGEGVIGKSPILIDHFGYESNQAVKCERNLPLLLKATKKDPKRLYLWFHLAETQYSLGNICDAEEACLKGLAIASNHDKERWQADRTLLFDLLARILMDSGRDPSAILETGLHESPIAVVLKYRLAKWQLLTKNYSQVIKYTNELMAIPIEKQNSPHLSFDEMIFTRHAIEMKVAALIGLNKYAEAAHEIIKMKGSE